MNSKILPTGWSIRTIGDLVRLSSGRQIDYSHVDDFPFPVYGANGILGWCSRFNVEDVILIGRVGASGSVHYVKGKAWANDNTLVLDEFKELDERFLYYWLVNHDLPKLATQTAQPLITQTTLKNIVIYNPPLNEQNRIGEILGNVNHTITQTEQLIEKLRAIKRGLLHDLLTRGIGEDGRVRDLSAIESDDSGWESRRFGELFQLKHGYAFKSEFFDKNGPYIVLTPGNFFEEGGFKDKGEDEKHYIGEFPKDFILEKDDLIVAMTEQSEGLLGATASIPESNKYLHNQRLGLVVNLYETQLSKKFLDILFNYSSVRNQIQRTAAGTKVRHTSPERIYNVEVTIPPIVEQGKIVDIISSVNKRIQQEEEYWRKMNEIKIGLMQDLLTGRVRVNIPKEKKGES